MTERILQYGLAELTFRARGESDPGFAGSLTARFEHEGGRTVQVSGFYDGDFTYRIRFMPELTGRWTYAVQSSAPLSGALSGRLIAVPGALPGPLRTDPNFPHHFCWANGSRLFPLGNTAYNLLSALEHRPEEADAFLRHYAGRGFNWVRFFLKQATWPTNGGLVWPWGGTPEQPDFERYNLTLFRCAEQALRRLGELGCVGSVILLHPHDAAFRSIPPDLRTEVVKRYVSYAVARLGGHWNLVWNLANEWARSECLSMAEADEYGRHLHAADPYHHLTACHHGARFEFAESSWADMASLQHRGLPHQINAVARLQRLFGRPVMNEEYEYEGDNHHPPNDPANVRRDHWALTMAGAYGTYGDKTLGPKVGAYFSATLKDSVGAELPEYLGHLRRIMESTPYWEMAPCNELLRGCLPEQVFCLAHPGKAYVLYFVVGQDVLVHLIHMATDRVLFTWYSPVTGQLAAEGEATVPPLVNDPHQEPRWLRFRPPDYERDWVLVIRSATGPA